MKLGCSYLREGHRMRVPEKIVVTGRYLGQDTGEKCIKKSLITHLSAG
jgi:hypothetical protein